MAPYSKQHFGFTIVELLIVIVIIGILASITIVAYNGIQSRAIVASLQNDLVQASKQLETYKLLSSSSSQYPVDLATADLKSSGKNNYDYSTISPNGAANSAYCLSANNGNKFYFVTSASTLFTPGSCKGLVGWWPMNGNANDLSGNANNGKSNGATLTIGQNSHANSAYAFDGISDQIDCGTSSSLSLASVTVSAWIYPTALSPINGVVNYGFGGYWLFLDATGIPQFYITSATVLGSAGPAVLNLWHYIVGTYDSGARSLYLDGKLVVADSFSGPIGGYGINCQIGSIKSVPGRYFSGSIDDVRIYNRALSTDELQAIYAAGAQ